MTPAALQALFARAEAAFAAGRLDDSRRDLLALLGAIAPDAAVLHLLGLVERRSGRADEAVRRLREARRLAPADPQIANNFGNALGDAGQTEAAIAAYADAIRLAPGWSDPVVNRALTLDRAGARDAAREALAAIPVARRDARTTLALAGLDIADGRFDEAAAGYDRILASDGEHPVALRGRARAAIERAEPDAPSRYAALVARFPDDRDLALGLSEAREAAGLADAAAPLAAQVGQEPGWLEGQRALARLRAEAGEPDPDRSFAAAAADRPDDIDLQTGWIWSLIAAGRAEPALASIRSAIRRAGPTRGLLLAESEAALLLGDRDRALRVLGALDMAADPEVARVAARIELADGRADAAAARIEAIPEARRDIAAWAMLDLAWRAAGDARHGWLGGAAGLIAARPLDLDADDLADLAAVLRRLHHARVEPPGQSLRGGTQSRGRLFARAEPALRRLADRIAAAMDAHRSALPPADPTHPVLRHRDTAWRLGGSWSVRLTGAGYHVPHIHPEGVMSSACHIALPDGVDAPDRPGWLEVGRPPALLALDLPPLATIRPRPGWLVLFPSFMYHGTRAFPAGERLTVAFDVVAG